LPCIRLNLADCRPAANYALEPNHVQRVAAGRFS
jgi:hypothetical protein